MVETYFLMAQNGKWVALASLWTLHFFTLRLLDSLIYLFVAHGRRQTVNEIKNIWKYKYAFKRQKVMYMDDKELYAQKHVGVCRCLWNIIRFFCRCRSHRMREQREGGRKHRKVGSGEIEMSEITRYSTGSPLRSSER